MPARSKRTIAAMIEHGFSSYAYCPACRLYREVDLNKLMATKGPAYSLWNRRCRCKKPGCTGWVRFKVGPGWHTPDYDDNTEARWIDAEWEERLARDPALRAAVERLRC
jgi:hypothetical protein